MPISALARWTLIRIHGAVCYQQPAQFDTCTIGIAEHLRQDPGMLISSHLHQC